jgi:hypothetical protein
VRRDLERRCNSGIKERSDLSPEPTRSDRHSCLPTTGHLASVKGKSPSREPARSWWCMRAQFCVICFPAKADPIPELFQSKYFPDDLPATLLHPHEASHPALCSVARCCRRRVCKGRYPRRSITLRRDPQESRISSCSPVGSSVVRYRRVRSAIHLALDPGDTDLRQFRTRSRPSDPA